MTGSGVTRIFIGRERGLCLANLRCLEQRTLARRLMPPPLIVVK